MSKVACLFPIAIRELSPQVLGAFTREYGHETSVEFVLNPEVPDAIKRDPSYDIAITNPEYGALLVEDGLVAPQDHRAFLRAPLAFACLGQNSADIPDDADAAREFLQTATGTLGYTGAGTSGARLAALLTKLGLAERWAGRLVALPGGGPASALRAGDVDFAALPLTNFALETDFAVQAICPDHLDVHIDLSLVITRTAGDAARDLAAFLTDPAQDAQMARAGGLRYVLE
ncbi:MAG: substrate-binding domain-containing protein [Pseudomonadota bacterium]